MRFATLQVPLRHISLKRKVAVAFSKAGQAAPINFMLEGIIDGEEVGLKFIPGYHVEALRMQLLDWDLWQ